jgi:hypothetical protein
MYRAGPNTSCGQVRDLNPERTAVPKEIIILPKLPVMAIGKFTSSP